ncbi:MAG: hypothetical protein HY883_02400 [Deltaproteobacteria bacterium]|nr:hypothetical protein [Deltaproteobacteria bacterium]
MKRLSNGLLALALLLAWGEPHYELYAATTLTRIPDRATHIIYRDTDGSYKAVRTSDGKVLLYHAQDASFVINGLLGGLGPSLYYSPSAANPRFREGRKIVLNEGVYNLYNTVVIPPNQDLIFEADRVIFNAVPGFVNSDIIRIDSSMNSKFTLGIVVSNGDGNTCVRVKPYGQGPDDMVVFTTSEIYIEAVVGSGNGLVVDGRKGAVEFTDMTVREVNLYGNRSDDIGIHVLVPASDRIIRGNTVTVKRVNQTPEVLRIEPSGNIRSNRFILNMTDAESASVTDFNDTSNNTIIRY